MGQDEGAVQRGQEFYRLKQVVQSPGDIYELNESARAIYIGPDSDIGEVQVTYFNPDEPNAVETAVVSVNGPLVGRIDSLPITKIPTTGQGARILIAPNDIVNNSYTRPTSLVTNTPFRQFNVPTVIDVMVALKTLPSIPETRADRTLRYPQIPYELNVDDPINDGSTDLIIPIYGRRMITVQCIAPALPFGHAVNMSLALVTLTPGAGNTAPRWLSAGGQAQSVVFVPGNLEVRAAVIRASDAARAGATFQLDGTITGWYSESDQPPEQQQVLGLPGPRGMADLLLINIADFASAKSGPSSTGFVDLFVKLADRET